MSEFNRSDKKNKKIENDEQLVNLDLDSSHKMSLSAQNRNNLAEAVEEYIKFNDIQEEDLPNYDSRRISSVARNSSIQISERGDIISFQRTSAPNLDLILNNNPEFLSPSQWTRTPPPNISAAENLAEIELKKAVFHFNNGSYQEALAICEKNIAKNPHIATSYKIKGNVLQQTGQLSKAIECYSQALILKNDYVEVYANLGAIYAQQEQWEQSIIAYEKALSLDPEFAGAYRNIAKVLHQIGRQEEAIEYTYQALCLEPNQSSPETHFYIGEQILQRGQLAAAIQCFGFAIALDPYFSDAYCRLAEIMEQEGEWQQAATYYRQAMESLRQPSRNQENPTRALAASQEASQEQAQQATLVNFSLPASESQEDGQIVSDSLVPTISSAEEYANLGSTYAQQQKWDLAIKNYLQAIAIEPNFAGVYRNLGRVYEKINQPEEACQYWFQAFCLEPEEATATEHCQLGQNLLSQERPEQAASCFSQAIKLQADYAPSYFELGKIFTQQQQFEQASSVYRQAIKQIEGREDTLKFYELLGELLVEQEQWESAQECYQDIIQHDPNCDRAYHQLGDLCLKQQQYSQALNCYLQAQELNPNFSWTYHNSGDAHCGLHQYQEAVAAYQQAIRLKPDFAWSYYNLGEALSQLNRWDEAHQAYSSAQNLDSQLPELQNKLNRVLAKRIKSDLQSAAELIDESNQVESDNFENSSEFEEPQLPTVETEYGEDSPGVEPELPTVETDYDTEFSSEIEPQLPTVESDNFEDSSEIEPELPRAENDHDYDPDFIKSNQDTFLLEDFASTKQITSEVDPAQRQFTQLYAVEVDPETSFSDRFDSSEEIDRDSLKGLIAQGNDCVERQDFKQAESCYRKVLDQDSGQDQIYDLLGKILAQQQRWDDVSQIYQDAVKNHPHNADFYYHLAQAQKKLGLWRQALANYQHALNLRSNLWQAYHHQGDTLLNLEQWSEATIAYHKVLATQPDFIWSHHNLGIALVKLEKWSEAMVCFDQVSLLDPNFWQTQPSKAEIQHQLGDAFFKQENWEQAIVAYQRAIALNPDLFWTHHNLGKAYFYLQQWNQAIIHLQQAANLKSDSGWNHYYLGESYGRKDQWDAALENYRLARDLDPELPEINLKWDRAFQQQHCLNCIVEDPHNLDLHRHRLELNPENAEICCEFAKELDHQDKKHEASTYYQKALELEPNLEEALINLGAILIQQSRWQEAIDVYQTAIIDSPNNLNLLTKLGEACLAASQFSEAESTYLKLIEIQPQVSQPYYHLGDIYARQKKTEQASQYYRKAMEIENNLD